MEEQKNMLNDATGIQSAKSRTQERLQTKQVVSQQINHKGENSRGRKKRDFERLEAYPAITVYEIDFTTDEKTMKRI